MDDEDVGKIHTEAEAGSCRFRPTVPNHSANGPPFLEKPPTMDDFILVKPISKGAFGKVWLGYKRTNSTRMLAIKVMKKVDLVKKNLMSQVIAERDAQAMSRSPFVVQLYYSLQSTHNIFLVMEYMIGGDVKSLLIMYGFFNEDMASLYAAEVTLALEYLHARGIVHRDLKPDNMLISDRGHIKLTDFGLSKVGVDGKASPQPGMMNQLELRTPGQILSLKSSLAFTIPRSHRKFVHTAGKHDSEIPSPLPPPPKTPKDKAANRRSMTRKMLTPQPTAKFPSQVSHVKPNSVGSTPPVKSLTPTLQDSLTWRNSTASDSNSRQACSLLQSSIDNRKNDSSVLCSSAPAKTDLPSCTGQGTHIGLSTANSCSSHNGSCESSVFSKDHSELVHTAAHSVLDPASCDSHVMPLIPRELEGDDNDTPLLHRTHSSVWNSYAAQRLRSMRDGSYCSDEYPIANSATCSVLTPNTKSVSREGSVDLLLKDTHSQTSLVGSNEEGEKQIEGSSYNKKKVEESKESVNNIDAENILSLSALSKVSDFSVEKARGILSSYDQSFGRTNIFTKSYTSSLATSIDLEMSSDFSNHFSKRDHFFNSTRISLEFGHSNISLDSGPELKDLSDLPSLSQIPLRIMTESSLNALKKHDIKSKFSRNASDKDVDSMKKSKRRLKKPGLRRVLSDTFDKCIHDESPSINGSHRILNNINTGARSQGVNSAPSMKYAGKKRIYADTNVSSESDKSPDISLNAHSGLTPGVSRVNINEDSSQKPLKAPRLDRKLYSQNLFQPESSGYTHSADITNDNLSKMENQSNNLPRQDARNIPGCSSKGLLDISEIKLKGLVRGPKSSGLTCDIDRLSLEHLVHNQTIKIGITPPAEPHHTGFIQSDSQSNLSGQKNFVESNDNARGEDCNGTQRSLAPVSSTTKTNDGFGSEMIPAISPVHIPQELSEDLNCQSNVPRDCELKDIHFLPPSSIPPISPGSLLFSSPTPGIQPPDLSLPQEESSAHHSPFYKPLIMLKGISTLNSSIESDGCHNTTIEMETNTSLSQLDSKLHHAINRSRNSSSSSMSDTNMADNADGVLQKGGKHSPSLPNPDSQAYKNRTVLNTDESPEDHNFTKPQSTYKDKLGAKTSKWTKGDEEQDKISPILDRKLSVMTAATPHAHLPLTEAAFKTPLNTPALRLRTPLRTPKSVRRGPDNHEGERILGTPDYLAPEMLVHKQHGFEVDWWALGVCLYEFLTGIPPFNDVTPEAVFENILNRNIIWPEGDESLSIEARDAIEALLTFEPEKRPKAKDVKSSAFFSSLDWDNILNMEPPFVPNPDNEMDTAYFEPKNAEMNILMSAVDM